MTPPGLRLVALAAVAAACAAPPPPPSRPEAALAAAESVFADLRELRDRLEVAVASGRTEAGQTMPFTVLTQAHNALRTDLARRLAAVDSARLRPDDSRAYGTMRRTLAQELDSLSPAGLAAGTAEPRRPACDYDPAAVARTGLDSLRGRMYACYGWAQSHVVVKQDTLDRLSIFGGLGREADAGRRRQLFLALEPVWRSVNGNNGPESPYRHLIAGEASLRGQRQSEQARASGISPDSLEPWLLSILTTWRSVTPDSLIEPWDWYYVTGAASRALGPRISRERLTRLNDSVYRALGADVGALRVRYDLAPRGGKTPVAYTTFGTRPRLINGSWRLGEPWVFATYRTGGLDNLNELLHETGHAIHIAAIRTRPAFSDWPDSDPFTEAVADLVALEVYEPSWQRRWLGDSVPLADGLRGRYGGVVLDLVWALFELRMMADPGADPNAVWSRLTRDYLRIRPHPELSWWAMRGQLIDSPGYLMNYAIGAMISAAIRSRTSELRPAGAAGDSTWYQWIAPRLFRFGLERPSRTVMQQFLGTSLSPAPILADMRRMGPPAPR